MSDLAATNCGCGCEDRCGCEQDDCRCGGSFGLFNGFGGGSSCSCILWIIILSALCGSGSSGLSLGGSHSCGCSDNSCILIILLLLICGGGC